MQPCQSWILPKKGPRIGEGTDTIALTGLTAGEKDLVIAVKDLAGNISEQLVIRIPDIKACHIRQPGIKARIRREWIPGHKAWFWRSVGSIDKLKNVQGTARDRVKNPSGAAGSAGGNGICSVGYWKKEKSD